MFVLRSTELNTAEAKWAFWNASTFNDFVATKASRATVSLLFFNVVNHAYFQKWIMGCVFCFFCLATTHFCIGCCWNCGWAEACPPFCLLLTDHCVTLLQTLSKDMIALLVFQLNCRMEAVCVHLGWVEKRGESSSSDNGPVWKTLARRMFMGKLSAASSQSGSLSVSAAKQNIELLSVPRFCIQVS